MEECITGSTYEVWLMLGLIFEVIYIRTCVFCFQERRSGHRQVDKACASPSTASSFRGAFLTPVRSTGWLYYIYALTLWSYISILQTWHNVGIFFAPFSPHFSNLRRLVMGGGAGALLPRFSSQFTRFCICFITPVTKDGTQSLVLRDKITGRIWILISDRNETGFVHNSAVGLKWGL
jgi:hypothetical protein